MTDETILKLMTSPIEGDVVIGANYLIKRPLRDIISFYENYGCNKAGEIRPTDGFYSYYSIKNKMTTPYFKVVEEEKLIWVGFMESYILDSSQFKLQIDSWEDKTI